MRPMWKIRRIALMPRHSRHSGRFPEREIIFSGAVIGKSFFAGCIANALLDRDVPVLMTNFPSILNRLTGVFAEDRAAFIASLDDYSLLVIDDLGVERNTEYAMEQMFTVIDSRYRSKRPLIVTTNLKLEKIKNPPDLAHARIYDRILERCAPVLFSGKNFREEGARATKAAAKDAPALVKKIGRTTYIVRVHFSKTSRETMSDKIKRMLKNEIQQM